ncbi:hypothetical protein, partial [Bilophila wadsworthia]|uniref:hypothetical protein n=1 Tax=Bilophila wadsworthia TaxID=35833 RepID=UPI003AB7DE3E
TAPSSAPTALCRKALERHYIKKYASPFEGKSPFIGILKGKKAALAVTKMLRHIIFVNFLYQYCYSKCSAFVSASP